MADILATGRGGATAAPTSVVLNSSNTSNTILPPPDGGAFGTPTVDVGTFTTKTTTKNYIKDELASLYNTKGLTFPENLGGLDVRNGDTPASTVAIRYPHMMIIHINMNEASTFNETTETIGENATVVAYSRSGGQAATTNGTPDQVVKSISSGAKASGSYIKDKANEWGVDTMPGAKTITNLLNSGKMKIAGTVVEKVIDQVGTNLLETLKINKFKRLKNTIALPMPTNVSMTSAASYKDITTGLLGNALQSAAKGTMAGKKGAIVGAVANAATEFAINDIVGGLGNEGMAATVNKLRGLTVNDRREQTFEGVSTRDFTFEWMLVPQSHEESVAITDIIRQLRMHMHPEVLQTAHNGFYMAIPSEFDIEFHEVYINDYTQTTTGSGAINVNGETVPTTTDAQVNKMQQIASREMGAVTKITTCVLTNVSVTYTPLGKWIAFDGTSEPVATHLSLSFREVEPLHRDKISKGNY